MTSDHDRDYAADMAKQAAGPELYDALKSAKVCIEDGSPQCAETIELLGRIESLIQKAEGSK